MGFNILCVSSQSRDMGMMAEFGLFNLKTKILVTKKILTTRGCFSQSPSSSAENADDDNVKFGLFVKDKFCLSDEAYLEVSQLT